ncbi:MAG: putative methyltransferase [Flavobacteriales bacterium]|jgi:predicted methyltransferase
MKKLGILSLALLLAACEKPETQPAEEQAQEAVKTAAELSLDSSTPASALSQILAAQEDKTKARYDFRHPKETIEFFGVTPGMTVVEVLPGDGWYSQILIPYLGKDGMLIGADYGMNVWPNFPFGNEEFLKGRVNWPNEWQQKSLAWAAENGAAGLGATFPTIPERYNDKVDAVLFIRALHALARFEDKGQFLSNTLAKAHALLKPEGIVGIVQHQASEDKTDEWADGTHGYLKKSNLIKAMDAAGFTFVAESLINTNEKDQPGDDDIVWRLPPSYYTSNGDEEKQKAYDLIGESNRMTLLFKKSTVAE